MGALVKGITLLDYARDHDMSQTVLRSDMDRLREIGAEIEAVMVKERGELLYVQRYKRGRAVFAEWIHKAHG